MPKNLLKIALGIFAVILIWHFAFLFFAGAVAITGAVWAIIVTSVIAFCIGILFLFLLTGFWVFVISSIGFVWTVLAIIFFPICFPILAPLLVLLLFISYMRRKRINNNSQDQ